MFGRKQRKIKDLEYRVELWQKAYNTAAETRDQKESELAVVQESYAEKLAKIEEHASDLLKKDDEIARADAYADTRIQALEYELQEARLLNENLKEEAAESSRMLELYKTLLAQIRVVVKLPARKK